MQVQDLLNAAARTAGIIASGETLQSNELTDALLSANMLLDSWSTERLFIMDTPRTVLTLAANSTGVYQIGPGGADFPTQPRPIRIERAGWVFQGNSPQPVEVPLYIMNTDEWARVAIKQLPTSTIPTAIYVDYGPSFVTISTYPSVTAGGAIALYSWQPLPQFANLADTLTLPPGFQEALRYNIAGRLAIDYGQTPNPLIVQLALALKDQLKQTNNDTYLMRADGTPGDGRGYGFNIYSGDTI